MTTRRRGACGNLPAASGRQAAHRLLSRARTWGDSLSRLPAQGVQRPPAWHVRGCLDDRNSLTDGEVGWLATITNFPCSRLGAGRGGAGLAREQEPLRLSQEADGLGHWDYDWASLA